MSSSLRAPTTPRVVPRAEHAISRRHISQGALRVLYRLHRAGFEACLVGGCVRDLLLARKPKDFDIVTDAFPEKVRRLFRNARIIGRRFRLVHVIYPDGVIEVSTGSLIALGLVTSWAAFLASGTMAVAYFKSHAPDAFLPIVNRGELAVLYCFVFLYLATKGSGEFSVDAARKAGPRKGNRR